MIRKTLTILSLIGLLLSVGLWAASYFGGVIWWSKNRIELSMGKLRWNQAMPSNTPFAWRYDGFRGFYLRGLRPKHPRYWGFRGAPPRDQITYGEFVPNVALPGITISWHRTFNANGVMDWRYHASILLWVPTLGCGIILCLCRPLYHRRHRKRKRLGLCANCGYNLKGLTEPRCPECNTSFDERLLKKDA